MIVWIQNSQDLDCTSDCLASFGVCVGLLVGDCRICSKSSALLLCGHHYTHKICIMFSLHVQRRYPEMQVGRSSAENYSWNNPFYFYK